MWYWNQDNFEGLVDVAESIAGHNMWRHFADYCRLRERGLRRNAFQSLAQLIAEASSWPATERRQFAEWILSIQLQHPDVHQLIATPLKQKLLIPTLEEWIVAETDNGTPCRLLGLATGDHRFFADALRLNPQDDVSRYRLVQGSLEAVGFQCHHLPDHFIGIPEEALAILDSTSEFARRFVDPRIANSLEGEFSLLRGKVEDWIAFRHNGGDSFATWCDQHGRDYQWCRHYYYKRRSGTE